MTTVASASNISLNGDFPDLSDELVSELVSSIDHVGYGVVPDYLEQRELDRLRTFVEASVRAAGNQYVSFTGCADLADTPLERMANSAVFRRLCTRVYEGATGNRAPDQPYYQILRCLTGASGERHSLRFHYDSYVLTVLLPICVPEGQHSGRLIMVPNVRPVRKWYAQNLIDKLLIDNSLTQFLLKRLAQTQSSRLARLKMEPGSLYFFSGYRSIHTNEPCDPDKIRTTALFHYVDPHIGSRLKRALRGSGPL
ncbi:hypothetical protein [Bradyrhizobium canariense]|uniref:2OG-Fe(II) oxygenase n=1 Tax=Bradyrhizobium canariense TaxID=255045 RepID=A0A1H1WYU1_9BRAD|nr:hypothetical protein [Bradyrhizobium canariense]SDT01389.1 hypothetical protein SAMN05444158_4044 [Bradyrhizobium canariense]